MSDKLDKLEKLAKDATPGKWKANAWEIITRRPGQRDKTIVEVREEGRGIFSEEFNEAAADMEFIAAANPQTVLKLIAAVKACNELLRGDCFEDFGDNAKKFREALAALDRDES